MTGQMGTSGSADDRPYSSGLASGARGKETRVVFGGDAPLEGMLGWPTAAAAGPTADAQESAVKAFRGGVVAAHPYPPHGANMDLPVVYRIAKSCREGGFVTLRFNFRSVGGSQGTFSGTEEHRDVMSAVSYMAQQLGPLEGVGRVGPPIGLAGYSFGSIMAARAAAELPAVRALALVGFGVGWEGMPPDTLGRLAGFRGPLLAVCAENDDYGSPKDVQRALTELGLEHTLEVVRGADHFLGGRDREVGKMVAEFFSAALGREAGGARD